VKIVTGSHQLHAKRNYQNYKEFRDMDSVVTVSEPKTAVFKKKTSDTETAVFGGRGSVSTKKQMFSNI